MNFLSRAYKYINEDIADPRTNKWFLVDSPLTIIIIICFYLYIVRKIGRTFMEHRKPYNINKIMIVYNILQVFLSSFIVIEILRTYFWLAKPNLFCDPVHESIDHLYMYVSAQYRFLQTSVLQLTFRHAFLVYLYFVAKITELLDTVFFILRKKWNQVTPLHVWHHSGMVFIGWVGVKYVPGGHTMPICALNSFVHIIMYVYYLLLSVNPELRKSIWWKKHITQLQLTQFVIILVHHLSAFAFNCGYPRGISYAILNNLIFIAMLFADFYRRAYLMKKPTKAKLN